MTTLTRLFYTSLIAVLLAIPQAFAQDDEADFTQAELDQMLAPIALYPDVLLSQILMASTYPLEIVEATRWSRNNPDLEGEAAVDAVADMDWDPSVKALVAFPQLLDRMYEDLDWTTSLGDAFLYQEAQVMDSIQGLRQRAQAAGNLESTDNIQVIREKETIIIEPARTQVVYVPYYNPRVIYGGWWWPAYPPVYWGPPPGYHVSYVSSGFYWGSGIHVSLGFFFSSFDWHRRHVVVVHHHHYHHRPHFVGGKHVRYATYPKWRHNPKHRRGVAYRHRSLQHEYGRYRSAGTRHSGFTQSRHAASGSGRHDRRHDSTRRSSQRPSAIGRTDDRRLAGRTDDRQLAGRTESRNFTRGDSDRRSSFSRTPSRERESTNFDRSRGTDTSRSTFNRSSGSDGTRADRWSSARTGDRDQAPGRNAGLATRGQETGNTGQAGAVENSRAATQRQRPAQSARSSFGFNFGEQPDRTRSDTGRANLRGQQQQAQDRNRLAGSAAGNQGQSTRQIQTRQRNVPSPAAPAVQPRTPSAAVRQNTGQSSRAGSSAGSTTGNQSARSTASSRGTTSRNPSAALSQSRTPSASVRQNSGNSRMTGQRPNTSSSAGSGRERTLSRGAGSSTSNQPARGTASSRATTSRSHSASSFNRGGGSGIAGGQRPQAGSMAGGRGQVSSRRGGSSQRSAGMSGRSGLSSR